MDAFAEDGVRVEAFGGDGGEAEEEKGGGVEGLAGRYMEVVLPAGGVDGGAGGDGAVVGEDAEDALGLTAVERDGVAVGVDVSSPMRALYFLFLVGLLGLLGGGVLLRVAGGEEGVAVECGDFGRACLLGVV